MTPQRKIFVHVRPLHEQQSPPDVGELSAAERIGIMWQLAQQAWTFKGEPERAESRLQRHVVRIRRGRR